MAALTPTDGTRPQQTCAHGNLFKRVIKTLVTCETTALFCADCGEQQTTPITDCR